MANSTVDVQSDVHGVRVVWDRFYKTSPTGKPAIKESWLKIMIEGAEGSIEKKYVLLYDSALQFKVSTKERVNDTEGFDGYYPRGKECAQLFCVLGNIRVSTVDMGGFDATKWEKRFPAGSLAQERLTNYIAQLAETAARLEEKRVADEKAAADALAAQTTTAPADAIPQQRVDNPIPTTAPANGKKPTKKGASVSV